MSNEEYPSVIVEWLDSCMPAENSEVLPEDIPDPDHITHCGFLVKETDEFVAIAGGVKRDPLCFDFVISIPKFAIQSITSLS